MELATPLVLDSQVSTPSEPCEREACLRAALDSHPEIAEARAQVEKAASAVRLARYQFIPDMEAFARYSFQNNVPFLADRFGTIGLRASVDLFDGGRSAIVRETQLAYLRGLLASQRFGVRNRRFTRADVADWIRRGAPTRVS